jgi:hypothetical protein
MKQEKIDAIEKKYQSPQELDVPKIVANCNSCPTAVILPTWHKS